MSANDASVAARSGGGAAEAAGVADQVDVHIGTLSKAAGAHGGFVACRADLRALLVTRGRPGVFSTALPAPVVAAASAALRVAAEAGALHERCRHRIALVVIQCMSGRAVHHQGGRRALSGCPECLSCVQLMSPSADSVPGAKVGFRHPGTPPRGAEHSPRAAGAWQEAARAAAPVAAPGLARRSWAWRSRLGSCCWLPSAGPMRDLRQPTCAFGPSAPS